jgi:type I restriction enzyme S subunit
LAKILIGSDQPYVRTTELLKQHFALPKEKLEQQQIATILSNVNLQLQKQQEYKSQLETLKKGLMQKLLTGQIRVKV